MNARVYVYVDGVKIKTATFATVEAAKNYAEVMDILGYPNLLVF